MQAAKAAKESTERLLLVTAFNIFGWTGACLRTDFKAMRPMDSETFDFVSPELGFTFVIEYVSLHCQRGLYAWRQPPTTGVQGTSSGFGLLDMVALALCSVAQDNSNCPRIKLIKKDSKS